MRPSILFPLFAEIRTLSGVGPKLEKLIAKVAGPRLVDLIFDLPVGVIDRSYRPKLIAAEPGRIATVEVNVLDHLPPRVKSQPYKVRVSDDTAVMDLVFFRADAKYLAGILPPGSRRLVSGRIESFKDRLQMAHPDYVVAPEEAASLPQHEAGLWPDRRPDGQDHGQGGARGAGACARRCRNGRMRPFSSQRGFAGFNEALDGGARARP